MYGKAIDICARPITLAPADVLTMVERHSHGRQKHWVIVDDVALDEETVAAAVQQNLDKRLLIAEGNPAHSVCLASGFLMPGRG